MSTETDTRPKLMIFPEILWDKVARVTVIDSDWCSKYSVYVHHKTPILIHGFNLYPDTVPSKGYNKERTQERGLYWWFRSVNYYEDGITQSSQRVISKVINLHQGGEPREFKTGEGRIQDIRVIDQKELEKYFQSLRAMPHAMELFG
jgi:hypothetical protein